MELKDFGLRKRGRPKNSLSAGKYNQMGVPLSVLEWRKQTEEGRIYKRTHDHSISEPTDKLLRVMQTTLGVSRDQLIKAALEVYLENLRK